MATRKFQISSDALKKFHAILKKNEKKNNAIKIGKMNLSHFLVSNIEALAIADDPVIATKQIILNIAGDFSTKPEDLSDIISLKDNLNYGDDEFLLLQGQLDKYVSKKKSGASISQTETNKCKTVGDCTKLVTSKI